MWPVPYPGRTGQAEEMGEKGSWETIRKEGKKKNIGERDWKEKWEECCSMMSVCIYVKSVFGEIVGY